MRFCGDSCSCVVLERRCLAAVVVVREHDNHKRAVVERVATVEVFIV